MFLHGTQQNMELTLTLGDYLKHKTNVEAFAKHSLSPILRCQKN